MAVITISKQPGAGGEALGKMIADKLGYTYADRDIIQMIAKAANVSMWVWIGLRRSKCAVRPPLPRGLDMRAPLWPCGGKALPGSRKLQPRKP